jgi:hypothetical protein
MQGRRLPDVEFRENRGFREAMEPGDYFRIVNGPRETAPSNLTGETWYAMSPNGLLANLAAHTVREEDDGSITVKPGDGSSNSILVSTRTVEGEVSWHGYITRGLWWSLAVGEPTGDNHG